MSESGVRAEQPAETPPAGGANVEVASGRVGVIAKLKAAGDAQRQAEVDQVGWIAAAADEWSWIDNPDDGEPDPGSDPGRVALVGERLWTYGGDGTPEVAEFLTHEIGPALGISPGAAGCLIADVLDLRHRLPLLWAAVMAGVVRVWIARKIAARTRAADLTLAEAQLLDAYLAPHVDGWTAHKILTQLEALIIAVAPAKAEERAAAAKAIRYAALGDTSDGVTELGARRRISTPPSTNSPRRSPRAGMSVRTENCVPSRSNCWPTPPAQPNSSTPAPSTSPRRAGRSTSSSTSDPNTSSRPRTPPPGVRARWWPASDRSRAASWTTCSPARR